MIQELSFEELELVDGGKVKVSDILWMGAGITAIGAGVLAAPAIVGVTAGAAAVYATTAGVMGLGAAIAGATGN